MHEFGSTPPPDSDSDGVDTTIVFLTRMGVKKMGDDARKDTAAEKEARDWLKMKDCIFAPPSVEGMTALGWREERKSGRRDYLIEAAVAADGSSFREVYQSGVVVDGTLPSPTADADQHHHHPVGLSRLRKRGGSGGILSWVARFPGADGGVLERDQHGIFSFTAPSEKRGWMKAAAAAVTWGRGDAKRLSSLADADFAAAAAPPPSRGDPFASHGFHQRWSVPLAKF